MCTLIPMEIGVRELRSRLASAVREAAAGERIIITVSGQPVASLGPVEPAAGPASLADLAAAGLVTPPRRHDRPAADDAVDLPVDIRLDRVLDELRGR
jgi:prevent-host-death family protein